MLPSARGHAGARGGGAEALRSAARLDHWAARPSAGTIHTEGAEGATLPPKRPRGEPRRAPAFVDCHDRFAAAFHSHVAARIRTSLPPISEQVISDDELSLAEEDAAEVAANRVRRRALDELKKAAAAAASASAAASAPGSGRELHIRFRRSPIEVLPDSSGRAAAAVRLEENTLSGAAGSRRAAGTGRFEEVRAGLVLRSIGCAKSRACPHTPPLSPLLASLMLNALRHLRVLLRASGTVGSPCRACPSTTPEQ